MERCKVLHVRTENGLVSSIDTDQGNITCKFFVNCAGQVSATTAYSCTVGSTNVILNCIDCNQEQIYMF